jgi:hypothetical protein
LVMTFTNQDGYAALIPLTLGFGVRYFVGYRLYGVRILFNDWTLLQTFGFVGILSTMDPGALYWAMAAAGSIGILWWNYSRYRSNIPVPVLPPVTIDNWAIGLVLAAICLVSTTEGLLFVGLGLLITSLATAATWWRERKIRKEFMAGLPSPEAN